MSRAAELLRIIQENGSSEINQMISSGFAEELFLDYKQAATQMPSRALDQNDRKNFGKAISGFGNGDGGLIIWGVVCKQGPNGDVPSGPAHIAQAVAFKTLLDGAILGLTEPQHGGVENFAFPVAGGPAGYVVSHVPAGYDIPFFSSHVNARGFYLRAGSSFHQVTPGILAGMFGRRPNPQIDLVIRPRFDFAPGARTAVISFDVSAHNIGRGMGRELYLSVDAKDAKWIAYQPDWVAGMWQDLPSTRERWVAATLEGRMRFPPGTQIRLLGIAAMLGEPVVSNLDITIRAGVVGGSGDEKRIQLYSDTLRSIREDLVHSYAENQRPDITKVILRRLSGDQLTRQAQVLTIDPDQLT
ncbi:MAG TPA: ATP-binding protein [Microvirga sp.]|jgi:hypothetical protein|nr:ATP-binding protein [Microvirga sp.]